MEGWKGGRVDGWKDYLLQINLTAIGVTTHKDLEVWKDGIKLVKEIYSTTQDFPSLEQFGIIAQLRRAAVSVPTNIAEGAARKGDKELIRFLYIALGSLSEIETLLIISSDLGFLQNEDLLEKVVVLRRKLLNLIKYQESKKERLN